MVWKSETTKNVFTLETNQTMVQFDTNKFGSDQTEKSGSPDQTR